jgi:hypothetical protein
MPKVNKTKTGECFHFICNKCDINKKFQTEKERVKCQVRHQKFCSCKNINIKEIERTDGIITKVSIL